MIKKFALKIKKIFILSLVKYFLGSMLFIVLILIIPLFINICYKFNSGIWFMQTIWNAEDALLFYGTILSGILTLSGVLITIKNQENRRREEESVLYKPIIELAGVDLKINCGYREVGLTFPIACSKNNPQKDKIMEEFSPLSTQKNPKYRLFFKNIGRGETFDARLDSYKVETNWHDISGLACSFSSQYIGEIVKDGYMAIYVNLPNYLIMPKDKGDNNFFVLTTILNIIYSDMFNNKRYKVSYYIKHKLIITSVLEESPPVEDINYEYAKVEYELHQIMPVKLAYSYKKNKYVAY